MSSAYLEGIGRDEVYFLPECVDDYVSEENPVRVIDAFVEGMSVGSEEGALPPLREMDSNGGRKGYSPCTLAKLFIWGYVNRVRSTRRLEVESGRNLELIWLLGKLRPDHSSISRFRKTHARRIKRWLKEFNLICAGLGLIDGEEVSVDGVFLKAVNSKKNNHTQKRLKAKLESLGGRIDEYLKQLEASEEENPEVAAVENLKEKLAEIEQARERARSLLEQAEASPSGQVSTVDADSRLLTKKSAPGAALVGMLGESAVDGKEHLIAAVEVVSQGNDFGLLTRMAEAAEEVLPEAPGRRLLADGGYFQINDLAACESRGWAVYVPPYPQRKTQAGKYPVSDFVYEQSGDCYRCPAGKRLERHADYCKNGVTSQTYYNSGACRECSLKDQCTGSAYRKIHRHENQATVDRMRERLAANPGIYRNRAATVEHPFGSMMFWNEGKNLLCRGLELANAELSLSALAYNLKRAVKVVGVRELVKAIGKKSRSARRTAAPRGEIGAIWRHWLKNWRSVRSQAYPQNAFPALPSGS